MNLNSNWTTNNSTTSIPCIQIQVQTRALVTHLKEELENVQKNILEAIVAAEKLAQRPKPSAPSLKYVLNDLKELSTNLKPDPVTQTDDPADQVKDSCNCKICLDLKKQETFLMGELQYLKKEVKERTRAIEILTEPSSESLLSILLHKIRRLGDRISFIPRPQKQEQVESSPKRQRLEENTQKEGGINMNRDQVASTSTQTGNLCPPVEPTTSRSSSTNTNLNSKSKNSSSTDSINYVCKIDGIPVITVDCNDSSCVNQNKSLEPLGDELESLINSSGYISTTESYVQTESRMNQILDFVPAHNPGARAETPPPQAPSKAGFVLNSPDILRKIFSPLTYVDLISTRLVNTKWKSESTKILLDRDCTTVFLQYDPKIDTFRKSSGVEWNFGSRFCPLQAQPPLEDFNKILEKSKSFPCTSFAFLRGNLAHKSVQKFFNLHGPQIKELTLKGVSKAKGASTLTSQFTLKRLLEVQVPTLKDLDIRGLEYPWKPSEQIMMPSLEYLLFNDCSRTAGCILRKAENLDEVSNPLGDYQKVKVLGDNEKCHLVKRCSCDEDTGFKSLNLFVNSPGSKLDFLKCFIDKRFIQEKKRNLAPLLSKLLESSKDKLEDLCLSGLFASPLLVLPRFEKLKSLHLLWNLCPRATSCFPRGLNLTETFPNLHVLDCGSLHCSKDSNWDLHFPPNSFQGQLTSVETLCIPDNCTDFWLIKLKQLCPNFKTLVVWAEWELKEIMKKVFQVWQHLESIKIEMYRLENVGKRKIEMDEIFTGFSQELLKELETSGELIELDEIADGQREPCLKDLKDLKCLWINLGYPHHRDLVKLLKNSVFMSSASWTFAFKELPHLKVTIEFDHNCQYSKEITDSFSSIAPYVNFVHEHHYSNNKVTKASH